MCIFPPPPAPQCVLLSLLVPTLALIAAYVCLAPAGLLLDLGSQDGKGCLPALRSIG